MFKWIKDRKIEQLKSRIESFGDKEEYYQSQILESLTKKYEAERDLPNSSLGDSYDRLVGMATALRDEFTAKRIDAEYELRKLEGTL